MLMTLHHFNYAYWEILNAFLSSAVFEKFFRNTISVKQFGSRSDQTLVSGIVVLGNKGRECVGRCSCKLALQLIACWVISCAFLSSAYFFKNQLYFGIPSLVPDPIQTVCKDYQKKNSGRQRFKSNERGQS